MLHWLRDGTEIEARDIPSAIDALARMEMDLVDACHGSSPGEVLETLGLVASTLQVELPKTQGLRAYHALLEPLPPHVLKQAAIEVLSTHNYRTMPAPAAFLEAPIARSWALSGLLMLAHVRRHRDRLSQ